MLETANLQEARKNEDSSQQELTAEYFASLESKAVPLPRPIPLPHPRPPIPWWFGSRFMIWKQDPTVGTLGRRLIYIPGLILNGPRDSRINTSLPGTTPVVRNTTGDFIFPADTPEADCANAFAIVHETLTMYQRKRGGANIPWAWNRNGNTDPLTVHPRGFRGANAFYSRNAKSLKFGYFQPSGSSSTIYTCRSLDIVAHETGHAILDGLKPGWLGYGNPPQTGGLHEAFGDLSAIFLALSQLDQVEALIAMTGANLHRKNFLQRLAEQFGEALGRPNGLRNADNDLKLSQVSNEVHAISQVFTGGIYDVLADIFNYERYRQRNVAGPARVLLDVNHHVMALLLQALNASPDTGATYADVVNKMLQISHANGDPAIYRTFIRNRFTYREVVVSPTPLTAMTRGQIDFDNPDFAEGGDVTTLECAFPDHPSLNAVQDRRGCCGTMQNPEYMQDQKVLDTSLSALSQQGVTLDEQGLLDHELRELARSFM